jgi:hypothetical protein
MVIKKVALALTTLLIANAALADTYSKEEKTTNFIVTPSVAYRYDVFKWSIPSDRFPQKKLSELVWKNHIIQSGIKIETEPTPNQFTFLGQVKYGYILNNHSKSWDLDWFVHKDRLGNIVSEQNSKTRSVVRGNILDLSGAIGYSVNLFNNNLLTFYFGYDYSNYRNKNYGARQLAYNQNDLLYLSNKLFQKYYFKTQSPWLGLSLNTPLNDKFSITPTIKLYSFNYIGKGYWVLRDDLEQNPSYKHNAKGTGLGFNLDFVYKYTKNLELTINLETKKFKMKTGKAQAFYVDQTILNPKVSTDKLYDLSLVSSAISVGLKYKF